MEKLKTEEFNDQLMEDEMGGLCGTQGKKRKNVHDDSGKNWEKV